MIITKKWVMECGIGHWVVSNGVQTLTCDDSELDDIILELETAP